MPQIMLLLTCTCVIVIAFVVRAAQGQEEPVRFLSGPSDPVEVCEDIHWKVLGGGPLLLYKNNTQVDVSLYNWQFDSLQGIYNVSWLSPVLVNSSIRLCYALISSYCSEAVDVIDCDSSGELITPPTVNIATQASIGTDLPPPAQPSSETHTPAPSSPSAASPSAASPSAASPPVTSTTGNNTTDTSTSDNKIAYIIIGTVAGLVAIGVGVRVGVAVLFGCVIYWKVKAKKKKTNGGEDINMHNMEDRNETPSVTPEEETVVSPSMTPGMTPKEEEEEETVVSPGVTPGMTPEEQEEEETVVSPGVTPGMTPEEAVVSPDMTPGMTLEEEEETVASPDMTPGMTLEEETVVFPDMTPGMTLEEEEEAVVSPGITPEDEEATVPRMVDTSRSGSEETLTRLELSFQSSVPETKPTLDSSSLPVHGMGPPVVSPGQEPIPPMPEGDPPPLPPPKVDTHEDAPLLTLRMEPSLTYPELESSSTTAHQEALKKNHEEEDPEQEPNGKKNPTQLVDASGGPAQYLRSDGKSQFEKPTSKKRDLYFIKSHAQKNVRVEGTRELAGHGQQGSTVLRQRAIRTLQSDRGQDTDTGHDEEDESHLELPSSKYPIPSPSQVSPSDRDSDEHVEFEDGN